MTEQLKAENQLEWIGKMNNIQECVFDMKQKSLCNIVDKIHLKKYNKGGQYQLY